MRVVELVHQSSSIRMRAQPSVEESRQPSTHSSLTFLEPPRNRLILGDGTCCLRAQIVCSAGESSAYGQLCVALHLCLALFSDLLLEEVGHGEGHFSKCRAARSASPKARRRHPWKAQSCLLGVRSGVTKAHAHAATARLDPRASACRLTGEHSRWVLGETLSSASLLYRGVRKPTSAIAVPPERFD